MSTKIRDIILLIGVEKIYKKIIIERIKMRPDELKLVKNEKGEWRSRCSI